MTARSRLPFSEAWTPEFQKRLNDALEERFGVLNEYALIPYGGTEGQVLTKSSDRPYVVEWADAAGGGSDTTSSVVSTDGTVDIVSRVSGVNTEYDLSVVCCGGGGRPVPEYIESFPQRCGASSTTYEPAVDTPHAQAGDLAVWFIYWADDTDATIPSSAARIEIPTGWKFYLYDTYGKYSGRGRLPVVAYKFLTADDLADTFTADTNLTSQIRQVCSYGFVVRGAHPDRPFTPITKSDTGIVNAPPPTLHGRTPIESTTLQVTMSLLNSANGTTTDLAHSVLAGPDDDWLLELNGSIVGTSTYANVRTKVILREADPTDNENLIPGETAAQQLEPTAGGWTYNACTRVQSTYYATMAASGGVNRHHVEKDFELVAGEKYCFMAHISRNGTSDCGVALTYVDPDGEERGIGLVVDNRMFGIEGYWDPLADKDDVWYARVLQWDNDGVPSVSGMWVGIFLTAQQAGAHTFRICNAPVSLVVTGDPDTDLSMDGTEGSTQKYRCYHARFASGWRMFGPVYTPDGAVVAGTPSGYTGYADTPWWISRNDATDNDSNGSGAQPTAAFCIVPAWSALPPAKIKDIHASVPNGIYINNDGLTVRDYPQGVIGDDFMQLCGADFLIYPETGGAATKCYFEVTIDETDADFPLTVYLRRMNGVAPVTDEAGGNEEQYSRSFTSTLGNIIGVAVDFDAGEIKWYVNGTLDATTAMVTTTYPSSGTALRDQPLVIGSYGSTYLGEVKVPIHTWNFAGPFTHGPPAGFTAADTIGDPLVGPLTAPIYNIGLGVPVGVTGSNGEILLRSILGLEGIDAAASSTGREVELRLDTGSLTALAAADAAPSADYTLVLDATDSTHKKMLLSALNPTTTKGDIIARGSSALERLAVGADDTVLTADSSTATGLRWAAASGGGSSADIVEYQAADLVITSNATYQDTDLAISLGVGVWSVEAFVGTLAHATPDMAVQLDFTGTAASLSIMRHATRGTTHGVNTHTATPCIYSMDVTTDYAISMAGYIVVSTGGDLKIQARQLTSSGTSVTFKKGSWLRVRQLD